MFSTCTHPVYVSFSVISLKIFQVMYLPLWVDGSRVISPPPPGYPSTSVYSSVNDDTHTHSQTSYIVLWLDFRAGWGAAALGRVLGVLFHQLRMGELGDPAGDNHSCPRTTATLTERDKDKHRSLLHSKGYLCESKRERQSFSEELTAIKHKSYL